MLLKEQIKYVLHYAEDPVEWVSELVRGLEKRIDELSKFGTKVTVFQEHWHPASELPNMGEEVVTWVNHGDGVITVSRGIYVGWPEEIINKLRWCYPPKED